jgi:hypothetical protein
VNREARRLRTSPALMRPERVVLVRRFVIRHGVATEAAALADVLAAHGGVVVPAQRLARHLAELTSSPFTSK